MSGIQPGSAITGTFTQSGLNIGFTITTMNVTDVAAPIPATALSGRNAISIVNYDTTEVLYIGNSNVVPGRALGLTAGWEVGPGEGFNLDVTDAVTLYGVVSAGKTILIKVMEIA